MNIKLLIFGEGPTDYGTEDGFGEWLEGPIMQILRNLLSEHTLEFEAIRKTDLDKVKTGKKAFQGSGLTGHGKNILKIMQYIQFNKKQSDYDYLIYYADTDKDSSEKANEQSARRASRTAYQEVEEAFTFFRMEKDLDARGVAVIPLRMIESWLLADERALISVMGQPIDRRYKNGNFSTPELLWGDKRNPDSDYPKHVLERILSSAWREPNRETFLEIAAAIDISTLHTKCPISFPPVVEQLVRLNLIQPVAG